MTSRYQLHGAVRIAAISRVPYVIRRQAGPQGEKTKPATAGAGPRAAGLDGLRALAVAAVVVYHIDPTWLPGGFLGVDVFFVLSGYLITSLLLANPGGPHGRRLGRFWSRRARRLLPELLLVVVLTAFVSDLIGGDATVGLRGAVLASLCYVSNWWFIHAQVGYFAHFGDPPALVHLWSLGVEEQFYLCWPLLLAGTLALAAWTARRTGLTHDVVARLAAVVPLGLAVASFTAMATGYHLGGDPSRVYYGTDTHAGGLLLGAATAFVLPLRSVGALARRRVRVLNRTGAAGLVVAVVAMFTLSGEAPLVYRGGLAVVSLGCVPLCLAAATTGTLGRALSARPLVWLGRRSYGVYLWHWPVIALLGDVTHGLNGWSVLVELALPVVLAAASYRWVQQPVQTRGWRGAWTALRAYAARLSARRQWLAPTAVGVAAVIMAVAVRALLTAPAVSPLQSRIAAGEAAIQASQAVSRRAGDSASTEAARVRSAQSTTPSPPDHFGSPGLCVAPSELGANVTAIGDSVMLASAQSLLHTMPGIAIDAQVGRQMYTAPALLRELRARGQLRDIVVVGLGTNGTFDTSVLREILAIAGPRRIVAFVSVYVPQPWQDSVNTRLARFVDEHPGTVLIPWYQAAGAHRALLYSDHTHLQPAGGQVYATVAQTALERAVATRCP